MKIPLPKLTRLPGKMVIRFGEPRDQGFLIKPMGFAKIIQRTGIIPQLGIDQSHQKVRIHGGEGFEIHVAGLNRLECG